MYPYMGSGNCAAAQSGTCAAKSAAKKKIVFQVRTTGENKIASIRSNWYNGLIGCLSMTGIDELYTDDTRIKKIRPIATRNKRMFFKRMLHEDCKHLSEF